MPREETPSALFLFWELEKQQQIWYNTNREHGGGITPDEIIAKVGPVDAVYVRVDENKAYWVRGDETGSVDLW